MMGSPRTAPWLIQSALGVVVVAGLSLGLRAPLPMAAQAASMQDAECGPGYIPDADGKCQDVNECRINNGECDPSVTCTNTPGSRTCGACTTDFLGDGYYGCKDPNDCAAGGCAPVDRRPPAIRTSGGQDVAATSADGAIARFTASAIDNVDGALGVTCTPKSGSMFPVGPTAVMCSAADKKGNKKTVSLTINVTK